MPEWPALDYAAWAATCDTLHLCTQMVGKTAAALAPAENHWWHTTLRVTPRGLESALLPFPGGCLQAQFDLVKHELRLWAEGGGERRLPLAVTSLRRFFADYRAALAELGAHPRLNPAPQEYDDPTPFDRDDRPRVYDAAAVERFHHVLLRANQALREFRASFIGKSSPVQFFWGAFDLAVTRFSGRRNPSPPRDGVMREAYSHEVNSCGFWPGDRRFPQAAFYAYTVPPPAELATQAVQPAGAAWNAQLGEFVLPYEAARAAADPHAAVLEFCQSAYAAGAALAAWDRASLER